MDRFFKVSIKYLGDLAGPTISNLPNGGDKKLTS